MLTDDFLDSLPLDPKSALLAVCEEFLRLETTAPNATEVALEAVAIFNAYSKAHSLEYAFADPTASANTRDMLATIHNQFNNFRDRLKNLVAMENSSKFLETSQNRFNGRFDVVFSYEFSDSELNRIQSLINELRDQINGAEQFEPKHKVRIMSKLEALQSEMHRHMSSLDKLWGFIGDAGVVFGKLGNDAKPFVDRVKEIITITWEVQAKAEDLPTSTRLPFFQDEAEKLDSDGD